MTKRFSFVNYKGGTGKTSTLAHIAYDLAVHHNKKVLIVDTDSQGSVAYHLGIQQTTRSLYDVITQQAPTSDCIVNARQNLDIIPANERLFPAEQYMYTQQNREHVLSRRLSDVDSRYDFVLVDCSPSINLMNQNALLYAQNVIVPVSMEYMSLSGVRQLMNNIRLLNTMFQSAIRVCKIIPTFYDQRKRKTTDVIASLTNHFPNAIAPSIRSSTAISLSAGYGKTLFEYEPTNIALNDYKKITEEVMNHV